MPDHLLDGDGDARHTRVPNRLNLRRRSAYEGLGNEPRARWGTRFKNSSTVKRKRPFHQQARPSRRSHIAAPTNGVSGPGLMWMESRSSHCQTTRHRPKSASPKVNVEMYGKDKGTWIVMQKRGLLIETPYKHKYRVLNRSMADALVAVGACLR